MVGIKDEDSMSVRLPLSPSMPRQLKRHSEYYSERGNLTIQVKDTLFKLSEIPLYDKSELDGVPGQFFKIVSKENGTTFEDVNNEKAESAPSAPGHVWELKDVEVDDFTRLLWVVDPQDPPDFKATTFDDWEAVLRLSDRWMFRKPFNIAVRKLSALKIEPVKKIKLMHDHNIRKEWVIDALVELTIAPSFPEVEDAEVLGIELTTHLAKARERARSAILFWNRRRYEVVKTGVCEVFRLQDETTHARSFDWKVMWG